MLSRHPVTLLLSLGLLFTTSFSLPTDPKTLLSRASTCSANTDKLVAGINKNIELQKQEQAQLKVVTGIVDSDTVDQADFASAKSKFVDIVNAGITQRKANQQLAAGNKAADGLAIVANAQAAELKAVTGLTGVASTDDATFAALSGMFAGGIAQNQKNAKDAADGCTDADSTGATDNCQ
ncbi:hypothetical protein ONS95_014956 [Cadophora gregata]|uniref:uncharacterized protein n=1 Tax=Cadophora gregata TaxID=51156 RepID=UPI0026DD428D|nr:uncharacterized protein ONS95_014956 [Cadophora gregata]KAK0103156.1 hypothetical protein ONS96_005765 [Cadophora gregata f. sp. sojae]KAK0113260.1 hypothetical protein ONS95_014956 [Cadophora gregata]